MSQSPELSLSPLVAKEEADINTLPSTGEIFSAPQGKVEPDINWRVFVNDYDLGGLQKLTDQAELGNQNSF